MKVFKLSDVFLQNYKRKKPKWGFGELGHFVYKRTYARPIYNKNGNIIRTEKWWETVCRAVEGSFTYQKQHCQKLGIPWDGYRAQKSSQIMFDKIFNFKFTPPGRGLWIAGTDYVNKHGSMALNNCGFVSTSRIDIKNTEPFEWAMNALMLGVGVGFDTLGANKIIIKTPSDINPWTKERPIFQIPDSRVGWVEALRWKLKAYFGGKVMPIFDFNLIRKRGALIKGFGGISSGSESLKELLDSVDNILEPIIGNNITVSAIVDIMNLIARCVVSGNVRRSATLALGNIEDDEYINLKDPDINQKELIHHRWASNNSVYGYVGKTDYSRISENIIKNGEPGIIWIDNCREYRRMDGSPNHWDKNIMGINPCAEIALESFELCNLVEVFPTRHINKEEFFETLKYAYLYAKSITLVNTNSPETNAVMLKNRRIGVSVSGVIDSFEKFGRRNFLEKWCYKGYDILKQWDETYSDWLCIPRSKKISAVKPSGTVSLLAGVSPGIHYPHSKYYIRRVRLSKNSDLINSIKEAGYVIEDDKYSPNTVVVEFPVESKNYKRSKKDVTLWEQMNNAADLQRYWADNAVSITVTFNDKEEKDLINVLETFEDKLKSVSFLKFSKDIYEQAPYEEIDKETFEKMKKNIKPIKFKTRQVGMGENFCTNDSCQI